MWLVLISDQTDMCRLHEFPMDDDETEMQSLPSQFNLRGDCVYPLMFPSSGERQVDIAGASLLSINDSYDLRPDQLNTEFKEIDEGDSGIQNSRVLEIPGST